MFDCSQALGKDTYRDPHDRTWDQTKRERLWKTDPQDAHSSSDSHARVHSLNPLDLLSAIRRFLAKTTNDLRKNPKSSLYH